MHKKNWNKLFLIFIFLFIFQLAWAQESNTSSSSSVGEVDEGGGTDVKLLNGQPNKKRIRRHLNLIAGVKHDEEILIPSIPLSYKGNVEFLDIQRIKETDTFRILPTKAGNGIITVHNKKTGQILVEMRFDIRDQSIEKTLREVQALLSDIEGIEYKVVNGRVVLDGFVLLPKDLKRIGNVLAQFAEGGAVISSLVTLSPLAKKKIVEYIARDINNPEVTVTSIGDFIKLEGFVNSDIEKTRISDIVSLYLPDIVNEVPGALKNVTIADRKPQQSIDSYVINLIQVRPAEQKVDPPPKIIQFVIHVVEYSERYLRGFEFKFSPSLSTLGATQSQQQTQAPGSISEIAAIVDNLMPKLNWARNHGYIRLLDTASLLVQDKTTGTIQRSITVTNNGSLSQASGQGGQGGGAQPGQTYSLNLNITKAQIKSERSELVETDLSVSTSNVGLSLTPNTSVRTTVSVRSRQSAALAGIITKKSENQFGGPTGAGAVVTLNHGKNFLKSSSNYVLFVTPIVKSSASSGVDQIKKKFRMKE